MAEEASQLQVDPASAAVSTTVVVIGAGPAGMTLATLLQHSGVPCVVLERRSREHVAQRQRAGIVETRAVRMFDSWGLADRVLGGIPYDGILEIRVDGCSHLVSDRDGSDGPVARLCPQQVLVQKLTETFLEGGGDLRFEAADVSLHDLTGDRATVSYRTPDGTPHALACDFVAGCDGDRESAVRPSPTVSSPRTPSTTASAGSPSSPTHRHPHTPSWPPAPTASPPTSPGARTRAATTSSARPTTPRTTGPSSASGTPCAPGSATPPSVPARSPTARSSGSAASSTTPCATAVSSWSATRRTSCRRWAARA
ncbi:3-(3-hydroxy-phenyl)propionate/3-hydroxycinnamic acid hydroxylase [Streptomyces griseorubiginosus]